MKFLPLVLVLVALATPSLARNVVTAEGGTLRVLDKLTGQLTDLQLRNGQTQSVGHLNVTLGECRYPSDNPAGDAFAELTVHYRDAPQPVFFGWMIASTPGVSAMDHPRYDVWPISCTTS